MAIAGTTLLYAASFKTVQACCTPNQRLSNPQLELITFLKFSFALLLLSQRLKLEAERENFAALQVSAAQARTTMTTIHCSCSMGRAGISKMWLDQGGSRNACFSACKSKKRSPSGCQTFGILVVNNLSGAIVSSGNSKNLCINTKL